VHTFRTYNMENDHNPVNPIPDINWDAVLEAAAADAVNEGEDDEIIEELVLNDLGEPVGAFGLGLENDDGQPPEGQFQLEHHIPNMFGNEDLGINPNAGFFEAEPDEEALEIVAEELEQGEQNLEALEDFEALAIVPPPAGGLIPPLRRRDNLKRTPEDVYDLTLDHRPMRLKKPKKPTQ